MKHLVFITLAWLLLAVMVFGQEPQLTDQQLIDIEHSNLLNACNARQELLRRQVDRLQKELDQLKKKEPK